MWMPAKPRYQKRCFIKADNCERSAAWIIRILFFRSRRLGTSAGHHDFFSHAAQFNLGDTPATLLDTPGHLDFAAQVEQVLDVLDYAILVVAGNAPLSGHTRTLWQLLKKISSADVYFRQ